MTERERLLTVLSGRVPDKTPWYGDLSYIYTSLEKQGKLEDKYIGDQGYINFYIDMGVGAFFYFPVNLWEKSYIGAVEYSEIERDGFRYYEYKTPKGNLTSVEKYLPSTYSWAYTEHFIKSIEDLRIMVYIFENTVYKADFTYFNKIDALWDGYGLLSGLAPIPVCALQKLLTRWAGVENTLNVYMQDAEEMVECFRRIQDSEDPVFEILEKSPAKYIEFPENFSSEVTGRRFFEEYCAPCYQKRNTQLHKAGKFTGIHIDGTLKPCLSLFSACGFDAAESVTPAPVGDVESEDLRDLAGSDIVIWGGLPGALFSPLYSDIEFNNHLRKILDIFPPGSGFVLGVADQVPPDAVMERVLRVRDMVNNQGGIH